MKKIILMVLGMILLSFGVLAGSTELTECGYITESGLYHLESNLGTGKIPIDGSCFIIDADKVSIDCQKHTIRGDNDGAGFGFFAYDQSNIKITGCYVDSFGKGISFSRVDGVDIHNSDLSDNEVSGVSLYRCDTVDIDGTSMNSMDSTYGFGLYLYYTDNVDVDADMKNNYYGAYTYYSDNVDFYHANFHDNNFGLYVNDGSDNVDLRWSKVLRNGRGIYYGAQHSTYNDYHHNTFDDNTYGVYFYGGDGGNFHHNDFEDNDYGVYFGSVSASRNNIYLNNFLRSTNSHAFTWSSTNNFDYGGHGNYWDDHTCTSPSSTGICSNDYETDGLYPYDYDYNPYAYEISEATC